MLSEEEKRARGKARGKGISAAHQLRQASVLADATSPVEAKIVKAVAADAAVAQKPVGAVLYNIGWWARPSRQFVERFAAHLPTVGDLARANVDFDALLAIFGPVESKSGVSRARKKLWELKCAAAAQFGVVEIGALPRKNAAARNPKITAESGVFFARKRLAGRSFHAPPSPRCLSSYYIMIDSRPTSSPAAVSMPRGSTRNAVLRRARRPAARACVPSPSDAVRRSP